MRRFRFAVVLSLLFAFAPTPRAALADGARLETTNRAQAAAGDPWAWFGPATADGSPKALAIRAFRIAADVAVPQDFLSSDVLDRDLLLSVVTRGFADLSLTQMTELTRELVQLGRDASAGRRFTTLLRALGPGYEKIGQFLGNRPDLMPAQYRAELSALSTRGRGLDGAHVEARFNEILGARLGEMLGDAAAAGVRAQDVVQSFDTEPLGIGSIGQAHRVTLTNGRVLVFKLLKPGARERLERNFDSVLEVLDAAGNGTFHDLISSIRDQTMIETDLRAEASAIDHARRTLSVHGINVPAVVDGFVGDDYMLMELAPGGHGAQSLTPSQRASVARRLFGGIAFLVFFSEQFHGDPHRGNVLVDDQATISLIDWGLTGSLDAGQKRGLLQLVGGVSMRSGAIVRRALRAFAGPLSQTQREMVSRELSTNAPPLKKLQQILFALRDDGVSIPSAYIQASRAMALADGAAREIDPQFTPAAAIRDLPRMLLRASLSRRPVQARSNVVRELATARESSVAGERGEEPVQHGGVLGRGGRQSRSRPAQPRAQSRAHTIIARR